MKSFAQLTVLLLAARALAAADGSQPMKPDPNAARATELATLGGGCFWCLEAVFERYEGVKSVTSGYAGGRVENPTYKQVCSGATGHAEVVQVEFDPARIAYADILEIFWHAHDPTTLNRQGADEGTQYRSVVFYHSPAQRETAEQSKAAAARDWAAPIVTEIVPFTRLYKAEGYHQDYYRNNPKYPYCQVVIAPKLEKLGHLKLKAKPAAH
jgi:peptide-methionine (S)-S-oxide reductase